MIIWMGKPLVLAIHARQIAEHGGSAELRDAGLLESALARAQQLQAHGDPAPNLAELAAALAYGLARNHPFVDGNKRTAAVCCETFIELNGATLDADDLNLYPQYLGLAEGSVTERAFAAWLRERLHRARPNEAHEPKKRYAVKPRRAAAKPRTSRPAR